MNRTASAELAKLRSRCVPAADGRPAFPVALVPEPDNPYDPQAIAVVAEAGRVGYLPRDDAKRYAATMRTLLGLGYHGANCTGLLNGGDRDRPNFGVVLTLSYPEACEEHVKRPA